MWKSIKKAPLFRSILLSTSDFKYIFKGMVDDRGYIRVIRPEDWTRHTECEDMFYGVVGKCDLELYMEIPTGKEK